MPEVEPARAAVAGRGRIDALDAARGAALAAMAAYHLTWDLGFLQLTPLNAALTPTGRMAAHGIAGAFLILVGVGLVLMNGEGMRWWAFARRLVRIGGAALLITGATYLAFPQNYIFFGILHCIALSSVLALPFLRLPAALTALCAAGVMAAPFFLHHPLLETPVLAVLGLASLPPDTNDWVPLFPWFGLVLVGIVLARLGLPVLSRSWLGRWRANGPFGRLACFAGRHSLVVYLVHQPVLLAVVYGVVSLTGPHPKAGVPEFRQRFERNCARTGGGTEACRIASRCVVDVLKRERLWATGIGYTLEQRAHAQSLARQCYEAAEGTAAPP